MQDSTLLLNLAVALAVAGLSAAVAARLGQSVILGYIVAGVAIGAYTPGFTADPRTVGQLADIGVILLMFAIGIQLSVRDLFRDARVALIGGHLQVALLLAAGFAVALLAGWDWQAALFFGAVVSNSSSTVLTRLLGERGQERSTHGRIALAWSTVQDLYTVVLVVALTAVTGGGAGVAGDLVAATLKAAIFLTLLVPVGGRLLPLIFDRIALLGSRELFVLTGVALALGAAYVATLLGLSPALGAFIAGIALSESEVRDEVFQGLVPMRDIFAGLFFVSVGMLVDPMIVIEQPLATLAALALIVLVKGGLSAGITRLFRYPGRTALLTGVALAQCAEFSFLLAQVGAERGVLAADQFSLLLGASVLSIVIAPQLHRAAEPLAFRLGGRANGRAAAARPPGDRRDHVVLCGHGRVGRLVAGALRAHGVAVVIVDSDARAVAALRSAGDMAFLGSADNPLVLDRAGIAGAQLLVLAIPETLAARGAVRYARAVNPAIVVVARSHSDAARAALAALGVDEVVLGEEELALELTRFALRHRGIPRDDVEATVSGMRLRGGAAGV